MPAKPKDQPQATDEKLQQQLTDDGAIETKRYEMDPRNIRLLPAGENARYMTAEQMARLVANLKRDRTLTSTVLVYKLDPNSDEVTAISGNHRTEAAQQAELPKVDVIEIVTRLSLERLRAIQLSHNSITGQDDINILLALYDELPLEEKLYSGLTDDDFNALQPLDLTGLSVGQPEYQTVELMFFPAEAETFASLIKSLKLNERVKQQFWVAHLDDFDRVFDAVVGTKEAKNIHNTALAFRAMADLALERLEQLATESEQPAEASDDAKKED